MAQILVREAVKERVIIGRIALGATAETIVNYHLFNNVQLLW